MPNDTQTLAKSRRPGSLAEDTPALKPPLSDAGPLNEDALSLLAAAMLSHDAASVETHLNAFCAYGLSREEIIDRYIPAVARQYGVGWCEDQVSFAEVTIGTARLQGWLRELEPRSFADQIPLFAPEVLLVVPAGAFHTLGAMVAASQFRRLGVLVRLSMGEDANYVGRLVRAQKFDMVAISVSGAEKVEMLRHLVNKIRTGVAPVPPVVIGGPILETEPEIKVLTGADHATGDPEEALRLCGLSTPRTDASPHGPGS